MSFITVRTERPKGYHVLGDVLETTEVAILFYYHGWALWIPKDALVKVWKGGPYTCPEDAVHRAKENPHSYYGALTLIELAEEQKNFPLIAGD